MGRIAGPWGVRGWVRVQPFSEHPGALTDYPVWQLGRGATEGPHGLETRSCKATGHRAAGRRGDARRGAGAERHGSRGAARGPAGSG
ncbi:MAG: hypothetical protein IPK29_06105 [Betaproteobacteria bacterium]|nr:hypothetical protein [Betaproteobacteria bacterium]